MTMQHSTGITTGLEVFTVTADTQSEVVKALSAHAEAVLRHADGFVAAAVHRSLDGSRVVLYTQWRSLADRRACQENAATRALYEQLSSPAPIVSNTYELAASL